MSVRTRPIGDPDNQLDKILPLLDRICREVVAADRDTIDRDGCWPQRCLRSLQECGLGGLVVPLDAGGMGQGLYALARVCERIAMDCSSTALCFGMHCVGSAVLAAKATPAQRETYLVPIAQGRHLTTLSLSEPGTGAHFYLPESTLKRNDRGGFDLNGEKSFVTNGGYADSYVISAVHADEDAPLGHFSCAVVPAALEGVSWGEHWRGMGMRGNASRTMLLDNVKMEAEQILGQSGDQIWYVFNVIAPYFLVAMAGTYLGIASAALEEARRHLISRLHAQTARHLADVTILQSQFGQIWTTVERTRALVYSAARAGDRAQAGADSSIMAAKIEASDAAVSVVNEALSLTGGIGYRENSQLHRLLRDARAGHVMSPTTNLLRLWIGRIQLDQPVLTE